MKMTFHSERLTFLPLTAEDVPAIFALHSFNEVAAYNTIGIPENETVTRDLLAQKIDPENNHHLGWVIRNQNNSFVGEISLIFAADRFKKAEISYSIHPKYWGKGLASEAVKKVIELGFNTFHLHRIEAGVAVENGKSIRVLEKVGMKREGRHREILPLKTGWSDNFSYAILLYDYKLIKQILYTSKPFRLKENKQ